MDIKGSSKKSMRCATLLAMFLIMSGCGGGGSGGGSAIALSSTAVSVSSPSVTSSSSSSFSSSSSSANIKPTANAGDSQSVIIGTQITLDGSKVRMWTVI